MKISGTESKAELYNKSNVFFSIWRKFDLACAITSLLAILSSTFDYEINYPSDRTYSDCHESSIRLEGFRYATLILSLVCILFTLLRYRFKRLWVKSLSALKGVKLFGARHKKEVNVRRRNLVLQIILLLIFPYPGMAGSILIPLRTDEHTKLTCYTASELFYCIMFFRFYFIIRSITNASVYDGEWARLSCQKYTVKPGFRFALKCLLRNNPVIMIPVIFIMLLVFTSTVYRVLERPLDEFSKEYNSNPLTSMWFIFETISTLGFGDVKPLSYFGRTAGVFAYVYGAIILSLVIIGLHQTTHMNSKEKKVFENLTINKSAMNFIRSSLMFYAAKFRYPATHPKRFQYYFDMSAKRRVFSLQRQKAKNVDFSIGSALTEVQSQVWLARLQLKICNAELDSYISLFKSSK